MLDSWVTARGLLTGSVDGGGENCPMCAQGRPDEDQYGIRFFAGAVSDAYLQRSRAQPGYTVVVWRGQHFADPSEMKRGDAAAYWLEVLRVASALKAVFNPAHVNYMTWANAIPHVHTHVALRYVDDPCPEGPLEPLEGVPAAEPDLRDEVARLRGALEAT